MARSSIALFPERRATVRITLALGMAVGGSALWGERIARADSGIVPIWNGFHYKWKEHPHRLSFVMSRFAYGKHHMGMKHETGLKIGACPQDEGQFTVNYLAMKPGGLSVKTGTAGPIATKGLIDKWQKGSTSVSVDLGKSDLGSATVLIQGFRIRSKADDLSKLGGKCDIASAVGKLGMEVVTGCPQVECDKWDSGWHFGGASVELGQPRMLNGKVTFSVAVKMKPAESPDPVNGGDCKCYGANWPKNRATSYSVEVDYVVIGGAKDSLNVVPFSIAGETKGMNNDAELGATKKVIGKSGFSGALAGLTSFSLDLSSGTKNDGRYVRELGIGVSKFNYDKKGNYGMTTGSIFFSNKSPIPYAWKAVGSIKGNMIQVRDTGVQVTRKTLSGSLTHDNTVDYVLTTPLSQSR